MLTDVQDVTSDVSTPITSTPKKSPQTDVTRLGTGRSTYSSPAYSGSMYSTQTPLAKRSMSTMSTASQTKPKRTLAAIFCGYPIGRRGDGYGLDEWNLRGDVHKLSFMVNLREELRMQMWEIHTRYDCARKVLTRHTDLQVLPDKQIRGALRHIWCNWTYTSMETPRTTYKAIS